MDGSSEEERWSWEKVVWILETPNEGCEEVWKREIELVSGTEWVFDLEISGEFSEY